MVVLGRRRRTLVCCLFLCLCLCLALAGWPLTTSALSADEYAIKAAYLYNFAKFVEWPPTAFATPDDSLLICVIGDNPFGDALTNLRGKLVGHHPVTVQELSSPADAPGCHIVFIARSQQLRLKSLLTTLGSRPILTVSDIENFTQVGGIIGLTEVEQRIQFVINTAAVRRAGLTVSSQLLKLATVIDGNGGL